MTDAPPFDPPYFSVETTAEGVHVTETGADGSRRQRTVPAAEAARLWLVLADSPSAAPAATRSAPKKNGRAPAAMPPGAVLLAVPFAEKDAAKKLGARWNPEQRAWYAPPGADMAAFARWRTGRGDS